MLGKLRLGVGEMTFLYGLSKALTGTKNHKPALEHAYNVLSDLGEVAEQALRHGIAALRTVRPELGKPVRMMLAQRIRDLAELPRRIAGAWHVEYKYDGLRVQAHIWRQGGVVLFSRRLENITHSFPDIGVALRAAFRGKAVMVEGEIVAVDPETGKLLDFQTLMPRRRLHGVEDYARKIPVQCFLFDLLYLNGRSLLQEPLSTRKGILARNMKMQNQVASANSIETQDLEEVESFFAEALEHGAEGVVIKDGQGAYEAGTRGWRWIKYKKEYKEGLADTFDVVVVGGLHGRGRRAGTYGSLLVAAFDPQINKYYSLTKVGAGFTDEELRRLAERLRPYERRDRHPLVETGVAADVWFDPALVMEVTGGQLTISPVHAVARERLRKGGLALRFPRFLRWRPDKSPEQTTTVADIYDLYRRLKRR